MALTDSDDHCQECRVARGLGGVGENRGTEMFSAGIQWTRGELDQGFRE